MKLPFIEEYNRGKKVMSAISGLAPTCTYVAQIVSGLSHTLEEADGYDQTRFDHDQKTVELDLREDRLTEEFIIHRSQAYSLVRGMPDEGPNSARLPLMDYKRAMDRLSSSSSEEVLPLPSGSAPNSNP